MNESAITLEAADIVRGQYRGYRGEKGVDAKSEVETFTAVRLHVDSWRWAGVPFYIRTGKHLPKRTTEIAIQFRRPPLHIFKRVSPTPIAMNM